MSGSGEGESRRPAGDDSDPDEVRFVRVPRPGQRPAPRQAGGAGGSTDAPAGGARKVRRVRRTRPAGTPPTPAAAESPPTAPPDEPAAEEPPAEPAAEEPPAKPAPEEPPPAEPAAEAPPAAPPAETPAADEEPPPAEPAAEAPPAEPATEEPAAKPAAERPRTAPPPRSTARRLSPAGPTDDAADAPGRTGKDQVAGGAQGLRLRWVLLPLGVLVLAWLAACAVTTVEAVNKLQGGVNALNTARAHLHLASLQSAPVGPYLDTATGDFASAHNGLSEPWMAPLDIAPYVGRQLSSARSLASAAHTVTEVGNTALMQTQALLRQPHDQPAQRAALLSQLRTVVDPLAAQINRVNLGPSQALLPSLASRRAKFATDLTRLRTDVNQGSAALTAVSDLVTGPRTYLVFAANNAEMRAGSGDYLSVGTLTTSNGSITASQFTPTDQLANPASTVPVTGDMAALWGSENPSQDYRNLALSPQFPASAALATQMWQAQTGQKVDGVLVIDVDALRSILQAIGPVTAGGQTVTADSVDQLLLEQQYVGITGGEANAARQNQLTVLASSIFGAIQGSGAPITTLANGLAQAASGRHLVAWAANPTIEAAWRASGAGGAVGPDGLLLSLLSNGGNKLDPYQAVSVRMTTAAAGHDTRLTVRATFTNRTPPGLSSYAAGNDPGVPVGTYGGSTTLDFPRTVRSASISPVGGGGPDYGSEVLGVPLTVYPGQSTVVTWTLVFSGRHGAVVVDPSARVPPSSWVGPHGERFTDATGHIVTW